MDLVDGDEAILNRVVGLEGVEKLGGFVVSGTSSLIRRRFNISLVKAATSLLFSKVSHKRQCKEKCLCFWFVWPLYEWQEIEMFSWWLGL